MPDSITLELGEASERLTIKHWNFSTFSSAYRTGRALIVHELSNMIFGNNKDTEHHHMHRNYSSPSNDQLTGINYMFWVYSRLMAFACDWVPSFIFDVRAGAEASQLWNILVPLFCLSGSLVGTAVAIGVFSNTTDQVLVGVDGNAAKFINKFFLLSEISYIFSAMMFMLYLNRKRRFVHDFVLFSCSSIRLPAKFQRQTVVRLQVQAMLFALLAEPAFAILTLWEEFRQPQVGANLGVNSFACLRFSVITLVGMAVAPLSVLHTIVPVITCSLSCATAKHIHLSVEKQFVRLYGTRRSPYSAPGPPDCRPDAALTTTDRELVTKLSVESVYLDWPTLDERPASCANQPRPALDPAFKSRLFLYRSIVKTLSELRQMIRAYDRVFGGYHIMLISLNGLIVAQWIVAGVMMGRAAIREQNAFGLSHFINSFTVRTFFRLILFVVSNSILFVVSNRLPSQLEELRRQLFNSNLELLHLADANSRNAGGLLAGERELKLVWSLYDHVDRLTRLTNFRLVGDTYYGKQCLLLIFGREVSLILLYVQVVDIYSNV